MYYENYIIIEIPIPDFEELKKKYFDNNDTPIVLLNKKYYLKDPLEYFNPVMLMDRTGHFAISGATIALIVGITAILTTAGVITYGAITDTPVVFDLSVSAGMGAGIGVKAGFSFVWDIRRKTFDTYFHAGLTGGIRFNSVGGSYSVGVVRNHNNRGDYAGPFFDVGASYYGGLDYCYDPTKDRDTSTNANSFAFGNNIGAYIGYDYYWWLNEE